MALATKLKTTAKNSPTGAASYEYGPTGKASTSEAAAKTQALQSIANNNTAPSSNVTNTQSNQSRVQSNYSQYYTPNDKVATSYQRLRNAELSDPGDYEESEYTEKYRNTLSNVENSKPDAFTSKYSEQIASLLDSIYNQDSFSYNPTEDEGFQNYRDMYQNNARRAMQDTLGNAATLTGGYGSTAAQTAAQQSYDQTMSGLNSAFLDFWDRAYQKYRDNIANQYNQLNAFNTQDNIDYSRHRDDVTDWQTDRSYYANQLANSQNYDLNSYNADLNHYQTNLNHYTDLYKLESDNDQWEKQFALNRETQDYQNMLTEQAIQQGGIQTAMAQDQYDLYNYYRQLGYNYTQAMNLMNGLNADGTRPGSGGSGGSRGGGGGSYSPASITQNQLNQDWLDIYKSKGREAADKYVSDAKKYMNVIDEDYTGSIGSLRRNENNVNRSELTSDEKKYQQQLTQMATSGDWREKAASRTNHFSINDYIKSQKGKK